MIIKRDCIYPLKGKNRPLHIWLPDDYHETSERCPVMYFFDGHNLFLDEDATYGKSWGMKDFLTGWGKKMIVVGVECGHEGYERLYEYLPYQAKMRWAPEGKALGEETFRWIIEEIKPMIDAEFRTYPFRECTGIGGSSMGGLMALYGVVHHNRWFSKGACVSSAIGFCMDQLMADMRKSEIDPDTRVFLSWGTKEARTADPMKEDTSSESYLRNKEAAVFLTGCGARARLFCQVGGGHCEADWEKQVPGFMNFLWTEN
ncbi:MAG: alpha/beta hydrolase [Clostridia bacterium]|nr:alpha/beta hydrolase [Clostridia bacterium]